MALSRWLNRQRSPSKPNIPPWYNVYRKLQCAIVCWQKFRRVSRGCLLAYDTTTRRGRSCAECSHTIVRLLPLRLCERALHLVYHMLAYYIQRQLTDTGAAHPAPLALAHWPRWHLPTGRLATPEKHRNSKAWKLATPAYSYVMYCVVPYHNPGKETCMPHLYSNNLEQHTKHTNNLCGVDYVHIDV